MILIELSQTGGIVDDDDDGLLLPLDTSTQLQRTSQGNTVNKRLMYRTPRFRTPFHTIPFSPPAAS